MIYTLFTERYTSGQQAGKVRLHRRLAAAYLRHGRERAFRTASFTNWNVLPLQPWKGQLGH